MGISKSSFKESLVVFFLSLLITFFSSITILMQFVRLPPGNVFVGLPHYFQDYFYYLDQFYQGAHGAWLTDNNLTTELFSKTLLYPGHILLGKMGGIFGLESFSTYIISVLLLKFLFILLSYLVIYKLFPHNPKFRLITFILYLFSTSFPEISVTDTGAWFIKSTQIFRGENTVMTRFANVPSVLLRNIIFLFSFLLLNSLIQDIKTLFHTLEKQITRIHFGMYIRICWTTLILSVLLAFITASDAAKTLLILLAYGCILFIEKPNNKRKSYIILNSVLLIILLLPTFYIIQSLQRSILNNPVYTKAIEWDIQEQINQVSFLFHHPQYILFSFGPLGILASLGFIIAIRKKKTTIQNFGIFIFIFSIILYFFPTYLFIPVPGFRFLFPNSYIFASSIALVGVIYLHSKFHLSKILILIVYLIPCFITLSASIYKNMKPLDPVFSHLAYLPNELYSGFMFLRKIQPNNAIVLANTYSAMDLLIPGLTGKKTYSGHMLLTLNSQEKDILVDKFLYKWTDANEAKEFLVSNNITYVFFTTYDGNVNDLKKDYPFLIPLYENQMVSIFKY